MNLVKSNIVLLIAAGVLAVPTTIQLLSDAESFVDYSSAPLMFGGFTADNVGFIALGKPKEEQPEPNPQTPEQKPKVAYDQFNIQRSDKGWMIGQVPNQPNDLFGVPVNESLVENNVFAHLGEIRVDEQTVIVPGATPEQLEEYGLDEAHAKVLLVKDRGGQKVIAQLYIGNDAAGQVKGTEAVRGVFVREAGTNDVVLYEFKQGWYLEPEATRWIDRTLLKFAPETVTRFAIANATTGGKPVVFERKDNKASWTCAQPPEGRGAVRQAEVENFVQSRRWISVQDYKLPMQRVGNKAALGLLPPQIVLEFTFLDGEAERTAKIEVGGKVDGEENLRYLVSTEAPFLMTWSAGMVTPLELDVAQSWFDPAGPPKTPEGGNEKEPGGAAAEPGKGEKPGGGK